MGLLINKKKQSCVLLSMLCSLACEVEEEGCNGKITRIQGIAGLGGCIFWGWSEVGRSMWCLLKLKD